MPRSFTRLALAFGALLLLPTIAATGMTALAKPRPKADQRVSLVWYLSAHELRLTKDSLDRIGPDVPRILIDLIQTPDATVKVRVRACAALAFYPDSQTFDVLRSLLHERSFKGSEVGLQLRRQALRSLARGYGDRAVDDIMALRSDPEPLVREAVALSLGDAGSERALPMLETWLSVEPVLNVRVAVDDAVSKLRGR